MHAALHQPLFDHRRHIHERFDRDAEHPLPQQPPQLAPSPGQRAGGQCQQGRHAQVAILADQTPHVGHLRVRQRRLFGEQRQQRFTHCQPQLAGNIPVGDAVCDQAQFVFEVVVTDQGHQ